MNGSIKLFVMNTAGFSLWFFIFAVRFIYALFYLAV